MCAVWLCLSVVMHHQKAGSLLCVVFYGYRRNHPNEARSLPVWSMSKAGGAGTNAVPFGGGMAWHVEQQPPPDGVRGELAADVGLSLVAQPTVFSDGLLERCLTCCTPASWHTGELGVLCLHHAGGVPNHRDT